MAGPFSNIVGHNVGAGAMQWQRKFVGIHDTHEALVQQLAIGKRTQKRVGRHPKAH